MDASLTADCSVLTVGGLARILQLRLGTGNPQVDLREIWINVDYQTRSSSGVNARWPSRKSLLPTPALQLPVRVFARLPLAELPEPIGGCRHEFGRAAPLRANTQPAALLTVFDFRRKSILIVGVFDAPGESPTLTLHFALSTGGSRQAGAARASLRAQERNEGALEARPAPPTAVNEEGDTE